MMKITWEQVFYLFLPFLPLFTLPFIVAEILYRIGKRMRKERLEEEHRMIREHQAKVREQIKKKFKEKDYVDRLNSWNRK